MKSLNILLLASFACVTLAAPAQPRQGSPEVPRATWNSVEFSLQPRDQAAHPWTVRVNANGFGTYSEAGGSGEQPVTISPATMQRLTHGERRARIGRCETRQKKVANTGQKTIRYTETAVDAGCTFNFSEDEDLMDAANAFIAIAETIQAGQRLQHDLRFDRLSLDPEIDSLLGNIKNGSAIEVTNIAPVLQSLVADDHVIDRVRRKAARLLQDSGVATEGLGLTSSSR